MLHPQQYRTLRIWRPGAAGRRALDKKRRGINQQTREQGLRIEWVSKKTRISTMAKKPILGLAACTRISPRGLCTLCGHRGVHTRSVSAIYLSRVAAAVTLERARALHATYHHTVLPGAQSRRAGEPQYTPSAVPCDWCMVLNWCGLQTCKGCCTALAECVSRF